MDEMCFKHHLLPHNMIVTEGSARPAKAITKEDLSLGSLHLG